MTDDYAYRMSVELPNGAKFRAQGEVAEVRVDLDRFYERLLHVSIPTTKAASNNNGASHPTEEVGGDTLVPAVDEPRHRLPESLDQTILDRLFSKDKNGTVSLRALPHGEDSATDALVALIYGAGRLANEQQVTGSRLMKAAVQSGLHQVDRIDRSLSPAIGQYVTAAGFKKGRRYGLTNPGIRRAEEILTAILG